VIAQVRWAFNNANTSGTELPAFNVPIFVLFRPAQFVGMAAGWEAAWTTFLVMLFKAFALHQPMTHAIVLKGSASREVFHMKAATVPLPIYCNSGGTSGPDFSQSVLFADAALPQTPFTLSVRIRTSTSGSTSHADYAEFVGWGSDSGSEFRLISGNLQYGEWTSATGWRPFQASPAVDLEDGAWHTVSVVRESDGSTSLYSDLVLVGTGGAGTLPSTIPSDLVSGARSSRLLKDRNDMVFRGDVTNFRIYDAALSSGQIETAGLEPPCTSMGTSDATATGDPHLQNIHGERFDLMSPGISVLVNVPRGTSVENALLVVQANARRLGKDCSDMYFQELNVTGAWADVAQPGGFRFVARDAINTKPEWTKFGPVELKIVHGHTDMGIQYLNVFAKHLGQAGFPVGGLLGEDDHTEAEKVGGECLRTVALAKGDQKVLPASVAKAYS